MHYSSASEWKNLDFVSTGEGVVAHNLLQGIPFADNSFDLVYHSHVLEHFSKADGEKFISECLRVLKPTGVIRIAIPDLERIVRTYLKCLEDGLENPHDAIAKANYDWILLEMYDQTVRNHSGGNLAKYLFQDNMVNEQFVFNRIGDEGRGIRNSFLKNKIKNPKQASGNVPLSGFKSRLKNKVKNYLLAKCGVDLKSNEIGEFRLGGEIHQWMYDRYSLSNLLRSFNADDIKIRDAFTSYIPNWESYKLDGNNPSVRKPDSLFVEAIKK